MLKQKLINNKLPSWNELPNIELYMDQILYLANKYLEPIISQKITASMINNYVKKKMLPRPNKKKYSKKHVVLILMITLLKQVYSLDDIRKLINSNIGKNYKYFYDTFNNKFNKYIVNTNGQIFKIYLNENTDSLLQIVVNTVISKIISEKLIQLL